MGVSLRRSWKAFCRGSPQSPDRLEESSVFCQLDATEPPPGIAGILRYRLLIADATI